ncbi:hypothetical protein BJX99DRAFT_237043 [Aspergillus californicus]
MYYIWPGFTPHPFYFFRLGMFVDFLLTGVRGAQLINVAVSGMSSIGVASEPGK